MWVRMLALTRICTASRSCSRRRFGSARRLMTPLSEMPPVVAHQSSKVVPGVVFEGFRPPVLVGVAEQFRGAGDPVAAPDAALSPAGQRFRAAAGEERLHVGLCGVRVD